VVHGLLLRCPVEQDAFARPFRYDVMNMTNSGSPMSTEFRGTGPSSDQ
jgi:hypothetical protein